MRDTNEPAGYSLGKAYEGGKEGSVIAITVEGEDGELLLSRNGPGRPLVSRMGRTGGRMFQAGTDHCQMDKLEATWSIPGTQEC